MNVQKFNRAWIIARQDIRHQMRQGSTLAWLFIMPPLFFYFIGSAMSSFGAMESKTSPAPLTIHSGQGDNALTEQLVHRLTENHFIVESHSSSITSVAPVSDSLKQSLEIPDQFSEKLIRGEPVSVDYATPSNALLARMEILRVYKALYTVLADVLVLKSAESGATGMEEAQFSQLNERPRTIDLVVSSSGVNNNIPSGYEQSVPGIMVMFTLLVLLTSGAPLLITERRQGLLRRLASTPLSRGDVVFGKWIARWVLAGIQIVFAAVSGSLLFGIVWGPNEIMVGLLLASWAGLCASGALLLGTLLNTEAQASATGMLIANILAALGGCWWPIEITPNWMQQLQLLLPTGWAMDGLHKLINYELSAVLVIPHVLALLAGAVILATIAARRLRYI